MKMFVYFMIICLSATTFGKPSEDHYTTRYDNLNLDAILNNDRLLRGYIDCLLGKRRCTKDAEELKSMYL